ncbi:MAG: hypothetical protein IJ221_01420 [Oscillibacter sp.]|nr:hypothetical protein [Oscillibacter sp.]
MILLEAVSAPEWLCCLSPGKDIPPLEKDVPPLEQQRRPAVLAGGAVL